MILIKQYKFYLNINTQVIFRVDLGNIFSTKKDYRPPQVAGHKNETQLGTTPSNMKTGKTRIRCPRN